MQQRLRHGTAEPATFLASVELIQQQLRVKRDDRWSETVCKLKFHSFHLIPGECSVLRACEQ